MSTLKAINLQHPSSASVNATLTPGGLLNGAGMDLIVKQDFSAAATVSVNNCFTATYVNYRIVVTWSFSSAGQTGRMRVRVAGSDLTTSTYYWTQTSGAGTSDSSIRIVESTGSGDEANFSADITRPAEAAGTGLVSVSNNAAGFGASFVGAGVRNTTAYDGFTLYPSAGTITGTVRVYGYRNS